MSPLLTISQKVVAPRLNGALVAPFHSSISKPKVGAASLLKPDRRTQTGATFGVHLDIPAWFGLWDDQKLDLLPAAAGAVEADAPILLSVSRQHQITLWQAFRQAVPLDNYQAPTRTELFPCPAPRCPYPPQPCRDFHYSHPFGRPKIGSPSSGSLAPRPNIVFSDEVNSASAKYSSSQAARLKVVRAYR